ncbi:hypothetical protein [Celeribacter sp.]|uniref:hypothetical protein n=1 Tax=Celeribacter sp. TaxID=1890673 RepID=UPI003A901CA7
MEKLTKSNLFKPQKPKAETAMDKTTRIVRKLIEEEAEQRETKINRLRIARLGREGKASTNPPR